MFPPLFAIASVDTSVTALLGDSPVRFWPFGEGPPDPQLPYVVWQTVYGSPENYLGDTPDLDTWGVQVDSYGKDGSDARAAAKVIRDVLESAAYVVAYNGEFRDTVTRNYRYSFTIEFKVNR